MLTRALSVLTIFAALGLVGIAACGGGNKQTKPTTLSDAGTVQITPDNAESRPSR